MSRRDILPDRYIPMYDDFQKYISAKAWPRLPIWVREALLTGKAQIGELHRVCIMRKMCGTLGTGDGWQYSNEGSHFWLDGQRVGPSIIPGEERTIEVVRNLEGDLIYEVECHQHTLKKIRVPTATSVSRKGSRIAAILQESYNTYVPPAELSAGF